MGIKRLNDKEIGRIGRLIKSTMNHNRRKCNCEGCKWWWLSNVKSFPNDTNTLCFFELLPNVRMLSHIAIKKKIRKGKKKKEVIIQKSTIDLWQMGMIRMLRLITIRETDPSMKVKPKPLWVAWGTNNSMVMRDL